MSLSKSTITEVIKYCNRDLVPDQDFDSDSQYHSEWFVEYFSFLQDHKLELQLGDAFYQTRFIYKLMSALKLPLAKQKGIVKFQIIQYASICEAVLDAAIDRYFKEDASKDFSITILQRIPQAVSKNTRILIEYDKTPLFLCKEKTVECDLKKVRIDDKTAFSVSKGLIKQNTSEAVKSLYDLRNNVHILKAVDRNYTPRLKEAKEAFELMQVFIGEVRDYYEMHPVKQETMGPASV